MKVVGVILAIALLAGIVFGVGYGAYMGYEFLSVQWGSLNNDWKAILIVVAALLAACALFLSASVQSSARKYGLKGAGRVEAYNAFVDWYSMLKGSVEQLPDAATLVPVRNRIVLWGGNRVVQQINQLHDLLAGEGSEAEEVIEKAGHVFLEIKRELGHRGISVDRSIV